MRDLFKIYQIVESEILRCPTQYYVKDRMTYQPIIISFSKGPELTDGRYGVTGITESSTLLVNNESDQTIRPFYEDRYGGSVKIALDDQIYEVRSIDSYYIKFLKYHILCDQYFMSIPTSELESEKYRGSNIFSLASDVSGIMDVMFDRRARNQLRNLQCQCVIYDGENVNNGVFTKTQHDELRILSETGELYRVIVDPREMKVMGRAGEYNNYRDVQIEVVEPIGMFLVGCMALTALRCNCYDPTIKARIQRIIDYGRIVVDDPYKFDEVCDITPFYAEIQEISASLKD